MEVVMSGNVMRAVCVLISVLLFLVGCFGFGPQAAQNFNVALVSVGVLLSGSIALIAAAMTKPDK